MRDILVAVLVVAIGAGGCAGPHGHGGNVVAEYPVQSDEHQLRPVPVLGWTNVPAIYVLYARQEMPDWPDAKQVRGGWELGAWRLPKRSQLGFRPDADGGVVAVAGADETRLPPGRYCWHARPGSTPIDPGATALLGALIVGIGVLGVVAWLAYDFDQSWGDGPFK